jgi:hypothetical protein
MIDDPVLRRSGGRFLDGGARRGWMTRGLVLGSGRGQGIGNFGRIWGHDGLMRGGAPHVTSGS